MTRQDDAFRNTALYEQLVTRAQHEGLLSEHPSSVEAEAFFDTLRADGKLEGPVHHYIGDDLSDDDLDALWAVFAGNEPPDPNNFTPGWWEDKPHQLAYRLLLRLTRAEAALKASLIQEGLRDPKKRRELAEFMAPQKRPLPPIKEIP